MACCNGSCGYGGGYWNPQRQNPTVIAKITKKQLAPKTNLTTPEERGTMLTPDRKGRPSRRRKPQG